MYDQSVVPRYSPDNPSRNAKRRKNALKRVKRCLALGFLSNQDRYLRDPKYQATAAVFNLTYHHMVENDKEAFGYFLKENPGKTWDDMLANFRAQKAKQESDDIEVAERHNKAGYFNTKGRAC